MRRFSSFARRSVAGWYFLGAVGLSACNATPEPVTTAPTPEITAPEPAPEPKPVTLVTADQVTLGPLDEAMALKGKAVFERMCQACHRTDADLKVGPGWQGITKRRKPEWIINMTMHPEVFLETDPDVQKMEEKYLVPMPNQNISFDEARQVLEYMRQQDAARK